MHEQISQLEQKFGDLVEEHKQVLIEEEDILEKLQLADEIIQHSEDMERKFLDQSHSGEVDEELEKEMGYVVALLKAISSNIQDLTQDLEKEKEQVGTLNSYENKIFERSQELIRTHGAVSDSEIPVDIESSKKQFEKENANKLRQRFEKSVIS